MARRRLRVTGFTRFLIFLIFVAPLAYIGAAYYNGEDGIQKIKELLKIDEKTETVRSETNNDAATADYTVEMEECMKERAKLEEKLDKRDKRINELLDKIDELEAGN